MKEFEVGDFVECIDAGTSACITLGKSYEIFHIDGSYIGIMDDIGKIAGYYPHGDTSNPY